MIGRVALGALSLMIGCAQQDARFPEKYDAMERVASANLGCHPVEYEDFAKGRHLFHGCGREIEITVLGDMPADVAPAATNTFARETGCPLRETSFASASAHTQWVMGCGKQFTYERTCKALCRWSATEKHAVSLAK